MDLFAPTQEPKDLAITRAIEQAVEMLIADNIYEAEHFFVMAKDFVHAPVERFAPIHDNAASI